MTCIVCHFQAGVHTSTHAPSYYVPLPTYYLHLNNTKWARYVPYKIHDNIVLMIEDDRENRGAFLLMMTKIFWDWMGEDQASRSPRQIERWIDKGELTKTNWWRQFSVWGINYILWWHVCPMSLYVPSLKDRKEREKAIRLPLKGCNMLANNTYHCNIRTCSDKSFICNCPLFLSVCLESDFEMLSMHILCIIS